jgi:hypothetical protein
MALKEAARNLDRQVRSSRTIRVRQFRGKAPSLFDIRLSALAHWVMAKLATGELVLLEEVSIDVDGKWESYRFPPPRV